MKFKDLFLGFAMSCLLVTGCDDGVGLENNNNVNDNNSNQNNNNDNTNNQNNNNVNTNPDLVITYSEVYPDATEIAIFKEDEWIASVELKNTAEEAAVIDQLLFYISEPSATEVKNARLYQGATMVATLPNNETAGFSFRPDGGVVINAGETLMFHFKAQIEAGVCKDATTLFLATPGENLARSQVSGDYFTFSASGTAPVGNSVRRIVGNGISIGPGPGNPPEGDISQSSEDASLLEVSLFAGEDMTIDAQNYIVNTGYRQTLDDFKVWSINQQGDWVVVSGPSDPATWSCAGAVCPVSFADAIDIRKCEELRLSTTIDIQGMPADQTMWVSIDATDGVEATSNVTNQPLPSSHLIYIGEPNVWSHTQTIVAP